MSCFTLKFKTILKEGRPKHPGWPLARPCPAAPTSDPHGPLPSSQLRHPGDQSVQEADSGPGRGEVVHMPKPGTEPPQVPVGQACAEWPGGKAKDAQGSSYPATRGTTHAQGPQGPAFYFRGNGEGSQVPRGAGMAAVSSHTHQGKGQDRFSSYR